VNEHPCGRPRGYRRFLLGRYGDASAFEIPASLRGYRLIAFDTRREAREFCRRKSIRRSSRPDGFVWECSPVRIRVRVQELR